MPQPSTKIDWATMRRPVIALAPMADMTDSAFCRVVKTKAQPIVFREMVSSEAVVRGNNKTLDMTDIHPAEHPLVQQVFGSDPDTMAEAVRIIQDEHAPEGFDINMGCPVYKIVHNFNGAALMKEPKRAAAIITAMKNVANVPVSVKIRAGWEDPTECLEFCKIVEAAGADLLTVHGRTRKQGYAGQSDWGLINQMRQNVSIPVFANGDSHSATLTWQCLQETQTDGILIARGALGNPWIFSQLDDMLAGKVPQAISTKERISTIKQHLTWHCEQYGPHGVRTFRKHLSWYLKGLPGAKEYRAEINQIDEEAAVQSALDTIFIEKEGVWDHLEPNIVAQTITAGR